MLKQIVLGIVLLAGLQVGTDWADEALNNALFEAIFAGNYQEVQSLLSRGANPNVALSEIKGKV
ncbi:MAG: hypothetical protein JJE30_00355 [Desulfuromonadales bacterium]|nr:hypothetical protein [Desulfuromonadales bacterium]